MFGYRTSIAKAEANLVREFGITLSKLPDRSSVETLFERISTSSKLSESAQIALLYRLVVFNYLAASKILEERGRVTQPERLVWLTEIVNRSVDWSERAPDHRQLELETSQLNQNIDRFFQHFGLSRGRPGSR